MANKKYITIDGERHHLSEWCSIFGISKQLVIGRVKRGWDIERSITTPARTYNYLIPPDPRSETMYAATRRLKAENRWMDFLEIKGQLRFKGLTMEQQFYKALELFPPLPIRG